MMVVLFLLISCDFNQEYCQNNLQNQYCNQIEKTLYDISMNGLNVSAGTMDNLIKYLGGYTWHINETTPTHEPTPLAPIFESPLYRQRRIREICDWMGCKIVEY